MMYCIHGRSEKQKCKLCFCRSKCCDADVKYFQNGFKPSPTVCEKCGKVCEVHDVRYD